jgi:terminase large subunit-like protein
MLNEPATQGMPTSAGTAWRLSPHPKQWVLIDCPADIVIYGGRAGGGKSYALIVEPICRGLHEIPGFTAVIFRREGKQIKEAGGLWDQAAKVYPYVGGVAHVGEMEYRFPSGARIAFRHIENEEDKHKYAGSEICYLAFDELYLFTESQFTFLMSRNRSVCGVAPYIRATSNPHPGWLRDFIAPWVHPDWEGPKAQSGEILYQIRDRKGIRFVGSGTQHAKTVTFIEAYLEDNPTLAEGDPGYIANLHSLLPVEQARLLYGDWGAVHQGLVYPEAFDDEFSVIVEGFGPRGEQDLEVGGMDFGHNNPFCALAGYVDYDGVLWITYERYVSDKITIPTHSAELPLNVEWWCDPAGSEEIMQLRDGGHDARPCAHRPTKMATGEIKAPKRAGIDMVSHRMRSGRLKIIRARCRNLVHELGLYIYDPKNLESDEPLKKNDHSTDALRYLITMLDRGRYVDDLTPRISDQDREESVRAAQMIDMDRRRQLDLAAQANPFDPRWDWKGGE